MSVFNQVLHLKQNKINLKQVIIHLLYKKNVTLTVAGPAPEGECSSITAAALQSHVPD